MVVVAARCLQFILVVTGFSCLRALRNVFIHWRQNVLSFECLLLLLLLIKCECERVWVCAWVWMCVCESVWMCVCVYGDVVCLRECATCRWWLIIWLHYGRNRCSERWVVAVVIAAPARPSTTILSGLPVLLHFDLPFFNDVHNYRHWAVHFRHRAAVRWTDYHRHHHHRCGYHCVDQS